jgi:general secretion pathway protein L
VSKNRRCAGGIAQGGRLEEGPKMLAEAFGWWAARMRELVPERLRSVHVASSDAVIVAAASAAGEPAKLLTRRKQAETFCGSFTPGVSDKAAVRQAVGRPLGGANLLLRAAPGSLLEKRVVLPLAVEPELPRVIGYEMNRFTPFRSEEAFWTWTLEQRDRMRGRLHVCLSLVPKAPLLPLLAALEGIGLSPIALEAMRADNSRCLLPMVVEAQSAVWQQWAAKGLAIACILLAIAAGGLPFLQQFLAMSEIEGRIADLQPRVAEVQTLRSRIAAATAGRDAVAQERSRTGNVLGILAAVTELMPDDTFLNDLSLRQRQLSIVGQSAAAARLISVLATDPSFRDPVFAAPVTRSSGATADVFSIRTEVAP